MKSAYELAMERLNKSQPQQSLTEEQKAEISGIDGKFRAKIAERELFLKPKIEEARFSGDPKSASDLQRQLAQDIRNLEEEMEKAKEAVRNRQSEG